MKSKGTFLTLLFVAALVPARLAAQDSVDPRWLPWLGCWEPVENMTAPVGEDGQVRQAYYCVRPAAGGVEIATVVDGASVSSRTMVADAARHPISEDGCNGWQTAQWSGDNQRLFVSSEVTCEGNIRRTGSGLMAMLSPTEWIDAHAIGLGDERVPGAVRYRPAPTNVEESAGFDLRTRYAVVADARRLAAADLSVDDVAEASEHVDGTALQAFLYERGQGFDLDAANIAALADDGVSNDVIDLMVALSYPTKFTLDRASMEGEPSVGEPGYRADDRYGYYGRGSNMDYCGRGFYSYSNCSPYAYYSPLGWSYGYYNPYYFGGYGYGYGSGYGYGYGNPVIIVNPNNGFGSAGGRAVKGQGYTRINRGTASGGGSSSSTGRSAVGRSGATSGSSTRSGGSAVGRSGGSSTGTASGSSGGSSSSTGRTAKRRGGGGG